MNFIGLINICSTYTDNLYFGVKIALIGILVVFAVLSILVVVVKLMSVGELFKKKNNSVEDVESTAIPIVEYNSDALIAAITAAISIVLENEKECDVSKSKLTFRVRSIREIK